MGEGSLTVKGLNIFYREAGSGDPIVLLHCAGGASGQWRNLMDRMSNRYRLFAMDMFSHGKSDKPPPGLQNIYELEVDLVAAFAELAGPPIHLVGHSIGGAAAAQTPASGGAAAARYAAQTPASIKSLTLFEPTLFQLLANGADEEGWSDLMRLIGGMSKWFDAGDREGAAEVLVDYWSKFGAFRALPKDRQANVVGRMDVSVNTVRQFQIDPTVGMMDPTEIKAPTLLLSGAASTRAAKGVIDVLARRIPGATLERIEGRRPYGPCHPRQGRQRIHREAYSRAW